MRFVTIRLAFREASCSDQTSYLDACHVDRLAVVHKNYSKTPPVTSCPISGSVVRCRASQPYNCLDLSLFHQGKRRSSHRSWRSQPKCDTILNGSVFGAVSLGLPLSCRRKVCLPFLWWSRDALSWWSRPAFQSQKAGGFRLHSMNCTRSAAWASIPPLFFPVCCSQSS